MNSQHGQPTAVNRLERDFTAPEANQKRLSDLMYLLTTEGWLYLCVALLARKTTPDGLFALDVFSRRIIGWAFSTSLKTSIVVNAFQMACQSRGPLKKCVFHSDQGVQYASLEFRQALSRFSVVQSVSKKGIVGIPSPCGSGFAPRSGVRSAVRKLFWHAETRVGLAIGPRIAS